MSDDKVLAEAACDPVYFGYALLGWHAHPHQATWLRGSDCVENYLRTGHRWGKTESMAIKHLWKCSFKIRDEQWDFADPYESCHAALSIDQASIALTKAWRLLHKPKAEAFRKVFIRRMIQTPFPRLEFNNGSTWHLRSTSHRGKYLEGKDFDYCSTDEGALDAYFGYIQDEILGFRVLDRGGQIDNISTGKRGSEFNHRFDAAKDDPEQFALQGSTLDNPNIDHRRLKRQMRRLDKGLIAERILGGERPSDGVISSAAILRAQTLFRVEGPYIHEPYKLFVPPVLTKRYSTGWDLAKTRDHVVGWTLDITQPPYQLAAFEKFNQSTIQLPEGTDYWNYVEARIRERHQIYGGITTIDATGLGTVIADHLADIEPEALVFTGQRLVELIGCLTLAYGLGVIGHPHLEHIRPDGSTWTFTEELEEVDSELTKLDTATALALSLWAIREQLQRQSVIPLRTRVGKVKR